MWPVTSARRSAPLAHASRPARASRASSLFGIGGQGGVQRLAGPVGFAQRGEADAVVGQQPRIARQCAQRLLMVGTRFGRPSQAHQGAPIIGLHEGLVGRSLGGLLQDAPRIVEPLEAEERQALVVHRAGVTRHGLQVGLQKPRWPPRSARPGRAGWRAGGSSPDREGCVRRTFSRMPDGLFRLARCGPRQRQGVVGLRRRPDRARAPSRSAGWRRSDGRLK